MRPTGRPKHRDSLRDSLHGAPGEVLTLPEAAEYLKVHYTTLRKLIINGEVPAFKVGAEYRILRTALAKWIGRGIDYFGQSFIIVQTGQYDHKENR